jgi:dipeptidyl aminopeptidase/acylaminoacyl peptidase
MRFEPRTDRLISTLLDIAVVMNLLAGQLYASPRRPITVDDCVRTRRIVDQEVHISKDGSRVAYVVKSPDLVTNRNNYQLYIRDLRHSRARENGHLLLQADLISEIHWLGSEKIMALAAYKSTNHEDLKSHVVILNATTGARDRLEYPGSIEEYSASADGRILVFSVKVPMDRQSPADLEKQRSREERGYPISFGEGTAGSIDHLPEDEIYLATKTRVGKLVVRKLLFRESERSPYLVSLRDVRRLDLSPDGKNLLFTYNAESLPPGWAGQPYIQYLQRRGTLFYRYLLGLYDIGTARLRLGFNFPGGALHTAWSDDSRCYSVVGPSPFGTDDARMEAEEAYASAEDLSHFMVHFQHVFTVDLQSLVPTMVLRRENSKLAEEGPLCWKHAEGPILVQTGDNAFAWLAMKKEQWGETAQIDFLKDQDFLSSLESDGQMVVGVVQTTMIPPDLFAFDLTTKQWALLTDLNPEYRAIELGQVESIAWTNRYGSKCAGFLIRPVEYQAGKRYPMVFLSAPPRDLFISDAAYTTAYAPQSLANAGFIVVISQYPLDNHVPDGRFPGEMSDAYNWMSMVETAVDMLASRGMVDANRVGLGGFSRTSWLTDFTLTHSSYNFIAASSADSGIYTYGAYFAYNSPGEMEASETQVGGPPYGETFKDWLEYAPPFNAEKVRAAVLMEYTGTAEHGFEFFTALSRLGKAVQLYRYPKGKHPLDTPLERIASLQRNVDWFRFWIQGYEGTAPVYDDAQYVRWRAMRSRSETSQGIATPLSAEQERARH